MDFIFDDLIESIGGEAAKKRLTEQEELAYFTIFHTAEDKNIKNLAVNKIIQNHILFVISVAKKYVTSHVNLNDLIEQGILGIHRAVMSFNPAKGIKFISYAVWWIRQSILNYCYEQNSIIKLSKTYQQTLSCLKRDAEKLGIEWTELCTDKNEFYRLLDTDNAINPQSMDSPLDSNNEPESAELKCYHTIIPGTDLEYEMRIKKRNERLYNALMSIDDRQRKVLKEYFGIDSDEKTTVQIGYDMGRSRELIRGLKNRAIKKLHKTMKPNDFVVNQ